MTISPRRPFATSRNTASGLGRATQVATRNAVRATSRTCGTAIPTTDPSTRERGVNPDKRLDTIVQLHKAGESPAVGMVWWEINLPNGTYQVHLVAGDASNADEYLSFVAEATKNAGGVPDVNSGITLIHTNLNGTGLGNFADSGTIDVTVTDGNLTISEGPDAANNKIAYIEVDTLTVATFQDTSAYPDINDFTAYVTYNGGGQRVLTAAEVCDPVPAVLVNPASVHMLPAPAWSWFSARASMSAS